MFGGSRCWDAVLGWFMFWLQPVMSTLLCATSCRFGYAVSHPQPRVRGCPQASAHPTEPRLCPQLCPQPHRITNQPMPRLVLMVSGCNRVLHSLPQLQPGEFGKKLTRKSKNSPEKNSPEKECSVGLWEGVMLQSYRVETVSVDGQLG